MTEAKDLRWCDRNNLNFPLCSVSPCLKWGGVSRTCRWVAEVFMVTTFRILPSTPVHLKELNASVNRKLGNGELMWFLQDKGHLTSQQWPRERPGAEISLLDSGLCPATAPGFFLPPLSSAPEPCERGAVLFSCGGQPGNVLLTHAFRTENNFLSYFWLILFVFKSSAYYGE